MTRQGHKSHEWTTYVAIVGVGLVLTLPLVILGFPDRSHDGTTHAIWYSEFSAQIRAGDWYPRWLGGMNRGLGSPTFFFYPPLPYYAACLFGLFLPSILSPWHPIALASALALVASGLFSFLWFRERYSRVSSLIAAIVYMALPYRLGVDLYVRGSFGESMAFAWMPLVLRYALRIGTDYWRAVPLFAIAVALLILTHLPSCLLLFPLVVCFALVFPGRDRWRAGIALACGFALGFGLAGCYLIPNASNQRFVRLDATTLGDPYKLTFLKWHLAEVMSIPLFFWVIVATALAAAAMGSVAWFLQERTAKRAAGFWTVAAVAAFFLMTPASKPVWDHLAILRRIQFPWRFNLLIVLACAALTACASDVALGERSTRTARRVALAALSVLLAGCLLYGAVAVESSYLRLAPNAKAHDYKTRRMLKKWDAPEYGTIWTGPIRESNVDTLCSAFGQGADDPARRVLLTAGATASVAAWERNRIELSVRGAGTEPVVILGQLYYPGWKAVARQDGSGSRQVRTSAANGLLALAIAPGDSDLIVRFDPGASVRVGAAVSIASLVATIAIALAARATRRRSRLLAVVKEKTGQSSF